MTSDVIPGSAPVWSGLILPQGSDGNGKLGLGKRCEPFGHLYWGVFEIGLESFDKDEAARCTTDFAAPASAAKVLDDPFRRSSDSTFLRNTMTDGEAPPETSGI
ncbi:hypothetical protein [Jannaschia donghaensis]|uniref:hypothetical protein n=1 Tax=Jannaschia donghaensis TaxID=420998 RepID=UPI0011874DA5|nr:hypothetical protein [Jannaschia donghaensis]